jgi:tetratricopeptide (TPR) repeat protein
MAGLRDGKIAESRKRRLAALLPFCLSAVLISAQVDPRTALLERAGWDALAAGQTKVAAESFRQAIAADPGNARLYLGAATAAYVERRDTDAKAALERALALDPGLTRARALMGQVRHRSGDLLGALREYDTLTKATPHDTDVQATIERWRRELELQQRMQQMVGDHFAVSFEGPAEEALATKALELLDRAYRRIGDVLGTFPAAPVPVVLYTTEQFSDITRSPAWAVGTYDGTIRVPMRGAIDEEKELDRVLAHEFTHALVHNLATKRVPTWLNEGLATALESDSLDWAGQRVSQAPLVALSVLKNSFGRLTGAQAQLAYATSALAVHRLIQDAGGFAIANLLRDLGDGADFDAAFLHRMQRTFEDFQAALRAP